MILGLSIAALLLSLLPAAMFAANLSLFQVIRKTRFDRVQSDETVSVLIPARNEQEGIGRCIQSVLASEGVSVQVIVLDDASTDETAAIVTRFAEADDRVRLLSGTPLPEGWNGKQYACKQLADAARSERLLFLDADVIVAPDAIGKLVAYQNENRVDLLSVFPRQITGSWSERWLIPMMHFILLCYLPFQRMRTTGDPGLAAGCGQLFLARTEAYRKSGTHEAIKGTRHDGIRLPRLFRAAGFATDVVDGTELAECRMYRGLAEVVRGLLKNADEGIANPRLILIFTVLLFGCSGLPLLSLVLGIGMSETVAVILSAVAIVIAHLPRLIAARAFKQSWFGACCHVPATLSFLTLQWVALAGYCVGWRVAWRGRTES